MKGFFRDRFSIISFAVIVMIIIIAVRLFQLQIVNGIYYKNEADKKLIRINTVKAPRGEILDTNGEVLANNRPAFTIEITKTTDDEKVINESLIKIINILENNGDVYKDNFPIIIPYEIIFNRNFSGEMSSEELNWRNKYKVPLDATAHQAFNHFRERYNISDNLTDEIARKIISLRYELSEQGFNSFSSVELAFDVSVETVSEIEERHLEFPGVNIVVKPIRNYPNGTLASHVLGYIGNINQSELEKYQKLLLEIDPNSSKQYKYNDTVGKIGIEKTSEIRLQGIEGKKFVETDLTGRFSQSLENQESIQGGTITLTIDKNVQLAAETALKDTISKIKSGGFQKAYPDVKGGAAVVVNVNSGEILALANYPSFDPGVFSKGITYKDWNAINNDPLQPLFNRAISGKYAPGSTYKMITGIAALEEGITTIDEKILDKGKYDYYPGYQPACWIWNSGGGTHGYVNITDAIKVSCNYYFYDVGKRLGIEKLSRYAEKFGLNKKTGIELDGESSSIIASPATREQLHNLNKDIYPNKYWFPGDTLQASIGQSDSNITPIAMASYISTLANGGTQYQLHLIKSEKSYDDKIIYTPDKSPTIIDKIDINRMNLDSVLRGMELVVSDSRGSGYSTFVNFPIKVAGKTGTSQTGIGNKSPHAWFVSFAPYDNPEIAVVVLIEHGGSGSYSAPVAKEIYKEYYKEYFKEDNLEEENIHQNNSEGFYVEVENLEEDIITSEQNINVNDQELEE